MKISIKMAYMLDGGIRKEKRKKKNIMEKLFEDDNGYVYPFEDGYKVHWKNKKYKPDIDIIFPHHWEACYYLRSVGK